MRKILLALSCVIVCVSPALSSVNLQGHEIYPHVYGGRLSAAIHGMDSRGYFRYDSVAEYFTEADDYPAKEALGFTADGNSRLILRAETPVSGSVTFTVPSSLGAVLETLSKDKSPSSSITITTTEIYPGQYRATAETSQPKHERSKSAPLLS